MKINIKKQVKRYCRQRDAAVFKAVVDGNLDPLKELGRQNDIPVPSDEILIISAHKLCCNITTMPKELQEQSKEWLLKNGYSMKIF